MLHFHINLSMTTKRVEIPATIDRIISKTRSKTCLLAVIVCLIIPSDADPNDIVTKITFNIYIYVCNCILYCKLLRKLINVIGNCFLWCSSYRIQTSFIRYSSILVINTIKHINHKIIRKSCNFLEFLIIDIIQTIPIQEEQEQRQQASLSINISLVNNDHNTCNRKYSKTTITVNDITVKIFFARGAGVYSWVSKRTTSIC